MNLRRLVMLGHTVGALLFAATVTFAADAPVLQSVTATTEVHAASALTTADEYKHQQDTAPEVVKINIVTVKTQAATTEDKNPGALLVTARAVITGVTRSKSNLQVGTAIYLLYGYAPPAPGVPAPAPTPIVKVGADYLAYLTGGPGETPYLPVAGAQSFVNPVVAAAAGPMADPAVLPAPNNPTPAGSVRLRDNALAQFVKLSQSGGKWYVQVAGSDPVPLQTIADAKPVLLVYYSAPLRAPLTQPTVLIYQAGVQPAPPPSMSKQTVERALILDSAHQPIADTLWAVRVEANIKPVPLPLWHWANYKLDIEDPDTHKIQTILLSGQPAPAANSTTATGGKN